MGLIYLESKGQMPERLFWN